MKKDKLNLFVFQISRTNTKALFLALLVVAILGIIFSKNAVAQEFSSISISPLSFELTANPGDILTNKLNIYNRNNSTVPVKMEVEDFVASGEMGAVLVQETDNETYSLAKWIKVYPENIILKPNEKRIVTFEIIVPPDGEAGGHYGSVLASFGGDSVSGGSGSAISSKVASLVLLNVSGEVIEDLDVLDFSAPEFQEYGPVPFEIRFENKGTVHVKPRGFITITDMFGNKVKDLEFPFKNVLPGSVRRINIEWDGGFLMGKYTAMLVGSYGNNNEPLELNVVTFWVLPWKLMLGVSVVILIILTILFLTRKRIRLAAKILFRGEDHHTIK
jgi:hypothetical protein